MGTLLSAESTWHYVLGFLFALLAPAFQLYWIQALLWRRVAVDAGVAPDEADRSHRRDLPALVGLLERLLYLAAILIGSPEFAGIWLAMKVAGGWKAWSDGRDITWRTATGADAKVTVIGRHEFNIFLFGAGLSLLFAAAGAKIIAWWNDNNGALALAVAILVTALALATQVWAWRRCKQ